MFARIIFKTPPDQRMHLTWTIKYKKNLDDHFTTAVLYYSRTSYCKLKSSEILLHPHHRNTVHSSESDTRDREVGPQTTHSSTEFSKIESGEDLTQDSGVDNKQDGGMDHI